MSRILTGIQPTGVPHLGNILGAILPAIEMSQQAENDAFLFIANLHALTSQKDPAIRKSFTYSVAATWLAFGFDAEKNTFYRQSDVPEVCELAWILNCFTPFPMLANAHSFKDKADRLSDVNAGLFTYPVLMAADILLYDAEYVPVGKDQQQHLEMTRDIARSFNNRQGDVFVIPEGKYAASTMLIPGTDGRKMSSSYGNFIDVFLPEKQLRKQVMRITTDSTALEEPKNPDKCIVFKLFSMLAPNDEVEKMKQNYLAGGYGYGEAKQALFEIILRKFVAERTRYRELMDETGLIETTLKDGAEKARIVASTVLKRVRKSLQF